MATAIPAVPGLPVLGNLFMFRNDRLGLQEAAARTGPIARVMLAHFPFYIISDAELAHQVLVTDAASYRKSMTLRFVRPILGDGLITAEGEVHRRHRKLLAPAFAPKRLAGYGEVMVSEARRHIAAWHADQRVDLAEELMALTLAIAGKTLFGADVRGDARAVADGVALGLQAQAEDMKSPVRLDSRWPLPRHRRMRRAATLLDQVVYRLIADGRQRANDRGDVLSLLLEARDDEGRGLTDREIRDEVMNLLLAGHETTANALTWTLYQLAGHREVLARLVAEVDAVLGGREAMIDDLPRMPWNLAVIEETMRLYPPVYLFGRQAIGDVELAGHRLPAGTSLAISVRGIHRRADYYPDPDAFAPERMLPSAKQGRPRQHYLPFGAGPRVCIGSHFALLETQLVLATIVQRVRVRPLGRAVPEPMVTLRPRGGMPARIEQRATG